MTAYAGLGTGGLTRTHRTASGEDPGLQLSRGAASLRGPSEIVDCHAGRVSDREHEAVRYP